MDVFRCTRSVLLQCIERCPADLISNTATDAAGSSSDAAVAAVFSLTVTAAGSSQVATAAATVGAV